MLWPADLQCYRLKTRGPCGEDEVFIRRHGVVFCSAFEDLTPPSRKVISSSSSEDKWSLPLSRAMTRDESACLAEGKVYWPRDRECYDLLERGPCEREQWLVVRGDQISCRPRPCPCSPAAPDLCEVELSPELRNLSLTAGCQRCVVARAAAQDGLCQPGEELLVNPAGYGECGCQTEPPHLRWPRDGRCHLVHSQGPCRDGLSLQLGEQGEPSCERSLCEDGQVEYGGQCHLLGLRGPCRDLETLSLHPETLQPRCETDSRVTRSPWLAIPRARVRVGALPAARRRTNCRVSRRGRCEPVYPHQNSVRPVRRDPVEYLRMLRHFRGR